MARPISEILNDRPLLKRILLTIRGGRRISELVREGYTHSQIGTAAQELFLLGLIQKNGKALELSDDVDSIIEKNIQVGTPLKLDIPKVFLVDNQDVAQSYVIGIEGLDQIRARISDTR